MGFVDPTRIQIFSKEKMNPPMTWPFFASQLDPTRLTHDMTFFKKNCKKGKYDMVGFFLVWCGLYNAKHKLNWKI